jgi:hypothetical protein
MVNSMRRRLPIVLASLNEQRTVHESKVADQEISALPFEDT